MYASMSYANHTHSDQSPVGDGSLLAYYSNCSWINSQHPCNLKRSLEAVYVLYGMGLWELQA